VQVLGVVTTGVVAYWHWTVDEAVQVPVALAQAVHVATAQVL
jgi:hypothetical protein